MKFARGEPLRLYFRDINIFVGKGPNAGKAQLLKIICSKVKELYDLFECTTLSAKKKWTNFIKRLN